jgi:hypothetical protein
MKITISVENGAVTVSRSVEIADGNPRFDGWEINNAGTELLHNTAAMFSDPENRPANR